MKLYIGITDSDWFEFLRARQAEEMNFWRPRSVAEFRAIVPGELFLFKTRYPQNRIVGGAFFLRHTPLPLSLAWDVFGNANGVGSLAAFQSKISSLREDNELNPTIGCTILTQPFYFSDEESISPPLDWSPNIVSGKSYDTSTGEGARLYEEIQLRLQNRTDNVIFEEAARYGDPRLVRPRLGQGGFRVVVMEAYHRRCAITGERTLPVLQAAHIKPYANEGPHEISNGLFLRSDLHTLFDSGYMTVTNDLRVEVSKRIREEYSNGRDYYALHGRELMVLPSNEREMPSSAFLEWHQNNRFLGN